MIDWKSVFDLAHPEPGATEEEIAHFVATLGQPLSAEEIAEVNRYNTNPFPPDDPHHASWHPFDASQWQMPDRPVPDSYLSFVRYSNGGDFRTGSRYFQMYGIWLREMMLDRAIPQYMPRALPFAFNGGGVMYFFDMREPTIDGEYPIIVAHASCLDFAPYYSPKVADSFLELCRGRFNVERLRYGGIVLDEKTWPTCTDMEPLLDCCQSSPRKLRLFAVACCRRVLHLMPDDRFRRAVEVAERFAEGEATDAERQAAKEECKEARGTPIYTPAANAATESVDAHADQAASDAFLCASQAEANASNGTSLETVQVRYVALLRDIFGNPFRQREIDPGWLAQNDGAVGKLAKTIYKTGAFGDMPILGDALEEAGCIDSEMLAHCRGGGEHVRGCWVVDLLLDQS